MKYTAPNIKIRKRFNMSDLLERYQKSVSKNAKPHKELNPCQSAILDWATGLSGEVGEVMDIIKHDIFHGEHMDRMAMAKELGDVLWYLTALTRSLDMDLQDILQLNVAKLEHRYAGKGYDKDKSANRHNVEEKFTNTEVYKQLEAKINRTNTCEIKENPLRNLRFIVTGPDGAGKSTFCKLLNLCLKANGFSEMKIFKGLYSEPDKLNTGLELINKDNVIFDRFYYPDDFIYSQAKNVDNSIGGKIFENALFDEIIRDDNNIFVYLTADMDQLLARSYRQEKLGQDDYVNLDELNKVYAAYELWYYVFKDTYDFPFIRIDTSLRDKEETLKDFSYKLKSILHSRGYTDFELKV